MPTYVAGVKLISANITCTSGVYTAELQAIARASQDGHWTNSALSSLSTLQRPVGSPAQVRSEKRVPQLM